ncbi:MAG: glucan endo-1,3-beta-D-glucosidase [Lutibacter sp.]|jgi:hypothetical protein|nr:glucan endo-1,3-beta-D-glucosidase [Lutibacter sp.]
MKNIHYVVGLLLSLVIFTGCEEETYEFGAITAPSNIQISAEIVGADASNPFGDGSGTVHFTATADHAITYKYVYNGEETLAAAGMTSYNFSTLGVNTHTITVVAMGTAGATSTASLQVEVLATYAPPADLLTMLTADSSRTWRVKAEVPSHFGVGPADSDLPIWWAANPNDKVNTGMYDDTYVFGVDGSFNHMTGADGAVFGKATPMTQDLGGDQGLTPNGNDEFEYYPLADYSASWALTAPGGVETLTLSGTGFLGFYVGGSHSYTILSRTADEMVLRTAGAGGLGWFFILTAE